MNSFFSQLFFGIRVFFKNLTLRNYLRIGTFFIKRYCFHKPVPFSVVFALTYDCQCRCIHCSVDDYKRENCDFSTHEVKSVIDFIASWGPIKITFFGGEPLLRKDILELISYASKWGIRTSLDTNGLLLDKEKVVALRRAGIGNVNVSVDSSDGVMHDQLRQKQGCYQSAIQGIKLCVDERIPCLISTYASKRSIQTKDLEKIIILAKRLGASGVKILLPILSGKWRENETERLSPEEEDYVMRLTDPRFVYIEDALEMMKKKGKGCSALEHNLVYISPYGDIQPCPAIPVSFGNVRRESPGNIIKKMEVHRFYKKYNSCEMCLMNDQVFRQQYFNQKGRKTLPLYVEEITI